MTFSYSEQTIWVSEDNGLFYVGCALIGSDTEIAPGATFPTLAEAKAAIDKHFAALARKKKGNRKGKDKVAYPCVTESGVEITLECLDQRSGDLQFIEDKYEDRYAAGARGRGIAHQPHVRYYPRVSWLVEKITELNGLRRQVGTVLNEIAPYQFKDPDSYGRRAKMDVEQHDLSLVRMVEVFEKLSAKAKDATQN